MANTTVKHGIKTIVYYGMDTILYHGYHGVLEHIIPWCSVVKVHHG